MSVGRISSRARWIAIALVIGCAALAVVAVRALRPRVGGEDIVNWPKSVEGDGRPMEAAEARRLYAHAMAGRLSVGQLVSLGTEIHRLSWRDPSLEGKDVDCWNRALAIDPTYAPALQLLLAYHFGLIDNSAQPPPATYATMKNLATRLLQINPKDFRAEAYMHIVVIAGWLHGVETPDNTVDTSIQILTSLMRKDPSNPDVPYYIALAYIRQAQLLRRAGDNASKEQAKEKIAQAVAIFDPAVQAQPNSSLLYLRFYEILGCADALSQEDDSDDPGPARYVPKMREVLEKARNCVKVEDPAYADVFIEYAQFETRHGKNDEAEELLRELIKNKPRDQAARIALAKFLSAAGKRQEAIELLQKPFAEPGLTATGAPRDRAGLEWTTCFDLTNDLIDEHEAISDNAKRATLLNQIEESCARMEDKLRTWPNLPQASATRLQAQAPKLRGKIKMLDHSERAALEAAAILEKARDLDASAATGKTDWDLQYLLARAYLAGHQTNKAETQLKKVLDGVPQFVPARLMLTRLLISEGDGQAALEQLAILDQIAPEEPDVWNLKLLAYGP
jgi:hypothetical protein